MTNLRIATTTFDDINVLLFIWLSPERCIWRLDLGRVRHSKRFYFPPRKKYEVQQCVMGLASLAWEWSGRYTLPVY